MKLRRQRQGLPLEMRLTPSLPERMRARLRVQYLEKLMETLDVGGNIKINNINILFLSTDLCLLAFNSLISVLLLLIGFVHKDQFLFIIGTFA